MKNYYKRRIIGFFDHALKMHRTLRILIVLFLWNVIYTGSAFSKPLQTILISIEKHNVTIGEILHEIETKSNYNILVRSNDLDINEKTSLSAKNKSIEYCLSQLLANKSVTYTVDGKNISIFKPIAQYSTANTSQKSEDRVITGVVKNADNEPLMGASVTVMGHSISTLTDIDGAFQLRIPNNARLLISYIGYTSTEISTNGQEHFTIILEGGSNILEEVVAIGYGTITRKEMTSAISHISSDDFLSIGSADPMMQLQGRVAGLSVANEGAGDPNQMASLQIRGIGSREAGSSPLIVIDGVPGGSMENLNANDIESIDVLKDGAAAAIYGTRGGAGVILITTKKSKKDGIVRSSYSGYTSIDFARHELNVLSPDEYRDFRVVEGLGVDHGANTNWLQEVSRNAVAHNHSLSLSGGNLQNNYRASADYRNASGIDLRSGREEYGSRLTFTHINRNKLLEFTANVAPRIARKNWASWSVFDVALKANPTMPVMDPKNEELYMDLYEDEAGWNPVELLNTEVDITESKFLDWNTDIKFNIFPLFASEKLKSQTLNVQMLVGENQYDHFGGWFRPSTNRRAMNGGVRGEAQRSYSKVKNRNMELLLNYDGRLNDHRVRFTGGYSFNERMNSSFSAENKDFDHDALTFNNLNNGSFMAQEGAKGMSSNQSKSRLVGFFGRANYDYLSKYFLTTSYRYEGASIFGDNNKWGHFPAVSGAWRISEESFMKDSSFLNELKIRADFGITGNQNFGNNYSLWTMRAFGDYTTADGEYIQVWGLSKNANPDLKWEKGTNWNIGLDFGMLNNKIYGSINYYQRKQSDLLGEYPAPVPAYPFKTVVANVGTMQNTGIEVDIIAEAVRKNDFRYTIQFVGATNNNKFLSFSNSKFKATGDLFTVSMPNPGSPGQAQILQEGGRVGNFFTYKHAGFTEDGNWLVWNYDNTEAIPIEEATLADKRVTGNGLPRFTLSLGNTFTYKNLDLRIFFRSALGFDILNVHEMYYGIPSATGNVMKRAYGKNANIKIGNNVLTDYFIEKGDYLKLDVITIGYKFPVNNNWISGMRAYATARNLATLTGFSGVDPSTYQTNGLAPGTFSTDSGMNGSRRYYPSTTQVLLGLQFDF